MPLYVYACRACTHLTEQLKSVPDRHNSPKCERCGSALTELEIQPVAGKVDKPAVPRKGRK